MSAAKVLIFAPVDEARDTHATLQEAGGASCAWARRRGTRPTATTRAS